MKKVEYLSQLEDEVQSILDDVVFFNCDYSTYVTLSDIFWELFQEVEELREVIVRQLLEANRLIDTLEQEIDQLERVTDCHVTNEEIIDTLDWERDNLHFLESSPIDEWTERNAKRKRITIQALINWKSDDDMTREKMVAKKPHNDHVDGKCCPTCLERATFQTWKHGYPVAIKMNYCQACGQAIDWSKE